MDYLYELTLKHRELIEERLAELCQEDYQSMHKLLYGLFFELLDNAKGCKDLDEKDCLWQISSQEKLEEVQNIMLKGYCYTDFIKALNIVKSAVRDVIFAKATDNTQLYDCLLQNDKWFECLQIGIHNQLNIIEANEEVLKKVFELTPFGVFIYGDKRFIHVNTVGERLTGYTNEELNSMSIFDLAHPDSAHVIKDNSIGWDTSAEVGIKRFECKIINKCGSELWVDISVGQIELGGKPRKLATVIDITDRKDIESNLYRSEKKYRTFFNFSPDMMYLIDMKEGLIKEANPVMLNTLGVTLEEIRYMKLKDFYAGDNLEELNSSLRCLMHGNDVKGLGIKVKSVYGELFDFEVNCTPILENGKVVKVLCMARNITDRKKMEEIKIQALESMRLLNETLEYDKLKTEFFANLSHEFRTPLNVILGTLQVMDMFNYQDLNFTDEKMKKYSKIMKQNCYRLLRLVNNLIDLNKLDSGYMNLNMDNHDIVSIVSKIASSVADYIESKGIAFSFDAKTPSKVIACDPDKMERIILNLLSNAAKFTESGGRIDVELWDEKESVFIAVKDTGSGIPKEKQDMVFKRFVQIDKSLSRAHQGSGIGLSLVKSLVELHGGKIVLVSEAGEGCKFTIELPVKLTAVAEKRGENTQYSANNRIETINIEFADIYS